MDTTVTVLPGTASFNCKAASIPALSSGLIILGTPSRISVPEERALAQKSALAQ